MSEDQVVISNDEAIASEVARATSAVAAVTSPPQHIPDLAKLPRTPPAGKTVAWVVPGWTAGTKLTQRVEAAARPIGWDVKAFGFDVTDASSVDAAVSAAVDEGADYIVVAGVPSTQFMTGLAKATSAGSHVVEYAVETDPAALDRGVMGWFSCSYSSQRVGRALADFVIADSRGAGHGAFIDVVDQAALHETARAFVEQLDDSPSHCAGTLIPTSFAEVATGKVGEQTLSFLQANPSVSYVVLGTDSVADDLPALLKEAGLDTRVKVLSGAAPTDAHRQKIADGTIRASLVYEGSGAGFWLLLYGLAAHSVGITDALQVDGPKTDFEFVLWTTENIPCPAGDWIGPPDYKHEYLKLMSLE